MEQVAHVTPVAIDLAALGDTTRLWDDWAADASRRFRIAETDLQEQLPNWQELLGRFAEERAPVYLRRDADVTAALRRLHGAGRRLGVFTDAPPELARVALAQLGAAGRVDAVTAGDGALERLRAELGADAAVVRTRAELLDLR